MYKKIRSFVCVLLLFAFMMTLSACEGTAKSKTGNIEITDLQMALLCDIVYNDELDTYLANGRELYSKNSSFHSPINEKYIRYMPERNLPAELSGFTVIDFDHGNVTGFRAAAFKRGDSIVLVYCGSEDWADYQSDLASAIFDFSSQDGQAKRFAEDNAKKYADCSIYVTGYSMGGRLAYLGAETIVDTGHGDRLKRVCTFNGLGVKEALDFSDSNLSNIHSLETKFGAITANHIVRGDDVSDDWMIKNFHYTHVGESIYYDCTNPEDLGYPHLSFSGLGLDLDLTKHDLYTFIDALSGNNAAASGEAPVVAHEEERKEAAADDTNAQPANEYIVESYTDIGDSNSGESSQEIGTEALQAYLSLLERERNLINGYTWQFGYYGYGTQTADQIPHPVVFCDCYGDSAPELIYVKWRGDTDGFSTLNIVTFEDGQIRVLYSELWDVLVGGGYGYYLFQLSGDKTLYAFCHTGDEGYINTWYSFDGSADRTLARTERLKEFAAPGEIVGGTLTYRYSYTENGVNISEDEYAARQADMRSDTESVLLYNILAGDFGKSYAAANGCPAMTCDEAIAYLRALLGQDGQSSAQTPAASAWSDAYREFILNGGYLSYGALNGSGVKFGLYDMDADGTPELLAYTAGASMDTATDYVFTYADGKVAYVGNAGSRYCSLYYYPGSGFPGLFCVDAVTGDYIVSYYAKNAASISRETVEHGSYYGGTAAGSDFDAWRANGTVYEKTSNAALYALDSQGAGRTYLAQYTLEEIKKLGWETFAASYRGSSPSAGSLPAWSAAYRDFVMNKSFLSSGDTATGYGDLENGMAVVTFALHDMNADSTPELIVFNGFNGRDLQANYVFTYTGSEVVYCGRTQADAYAVDGWQGLFSGVTRSAWYLDDQYAGKYAEVTWRDYHTLSGNTVTKETVSVTGLPIGSGEWELISGTADAALYEASRKTPRYLSAMTWQELKSEGWEALAATYQSGAAAAAAPGSAPSAADMAGCDSRVVAPYDSSWLSAYETKYVKASLGQCIILRWAPEDDYTLNGYNFLNRVWQNEAVTVLARQGNYSLIKTAAGEVGWATSQFLAAEK